MRILHFTIAASRGGQTQYIFNLAKRMDKNNFQLGFVTFSESMKDAEDFGALGTIHYIPSYPERDREAFVESFYQVLAQGYDVLELHTTFWKSLLVEELAKRAGIRKVIIHAHASSINLGINDVGRISYQEALELHEKIKDELTEDIATDFWACSKNAAKWLYGERISEKKIKIINNPINVDEFCYCENKRKSLRKERKLEGLFVLGFLGRLEKIKNVEYAIKLAEKLHKSNPKIKLLIVGEGSQHAELEEKYDYLIQREIVCFEGYRKNVNDYYHIFDVLVFPSYSEGFPITLLEAQTNGLKCLCSEGVPCEVDVTGNVVRIALENESEWEKEILQLSDGYLRYDQREKIIAAGMDMESQVKRIEKMYLQQTCD